MRILVGDARTLSTAQETKNDGGYTEMLATAKLEIPSRSCNFRQRARACNRDSLTFICHEKLS